MLTVDFPSRPTAPNRIGPPRAQIEDQKILPAGMLTSVVCGLPSAGNRRIEFAVVISKSPRASHPADFGLVWDAWNRCGCTLTHHWLEENRIRPLLLN